VLEYRLLGPVQVYDDGRLVEAGPPRQRLVLAALLVDAGEVVGWDTLVDRVWGEQTPVDARGSMRAHITRIPLVESLTAALMRAQHALGRSADALAEYNRLRTRLAEELGTDPGQSSRRGTGRCCAGSRRRFAPPPRDPGRPPRSYPPSCPRTCTGSPAASTSWVASTRC